MKPGLLFAITLCACVSAHARTMPPQQSSENSQALTSQNQPSQVQTPASNSPLSDSNTDGQAGGFVVKGGAVYYRVGGRLIPMSGGGASGCFGEQPAKPSEEVLRLMRLSPSVIPKRKSN